jgi:hypothetical protein
MRQFRFVLLPLLAVALVALALLAPSSSEEPRRPTSVAVTQEAYACPAGSVITVAAGQIRPGTGSTAKILPGGSADPRLQDAKAWRTAVVNGPGVIVQQQGRGSGAVGFFAGTAPKAGGGGLVVGSCPGIVDDAWMLGLGSGGKHFSTLILTNLADSPAAVDISLWGPKGKIDAVGSEGIVVKPFAVRRIRLDELAAGEPLLAMHVHRRRGSLSAVVNDTSTATFRGTEPVSATASPRRKQVVGGLVPGVSGRSLMLLNPGNTTARVDVEVIGPKNTFAPAGLGKLRVPANSMRSITVPRAAGSGQQALSLTSDQPVSATVRMAPDNKDYAYAESVPALSGRAIAPVAIGKGIGSPKLVLSAPGHAASVELQAYDASMTSVASASVAIKAGTTRLVDLAKEFRAKGIAYVVVRPMGTVYGAATYVRGDGISSLALADAPVTVLGPQVRPVD